MQHRPAPPPHRHPHREPDSQDGIGIYDDVVDITDRVRELADDRPAADRRRVLAPIRLVVVGLLNELDHLIDNTDCQWGPVAPWRDGEGDPLAQRVSAAMLALDETDRT